MHHSLDVDALELPPPTAHPVARRAGVY